ncbi:site-specific DNA-methyltransferase [Actinomycetospora termitidis]|uniref:Site-specific DNA-methyltransferase n=1 Tax=Actinomycetospora termitidis TaxID=3053470 RepID=A0ABT7M9Y0_9PSEU|nr:site-specific DNA-methyltransferase [Actinomycetospora sp. Odt1-22]MDL5157470.1 site-specific DNA-methyltransferase [Actinomycetospora sp. Odt1-22]
MVTPEVEKPATLLYPRDPSLDPQLVWRGKDEQDSVDLAVTAPPIYIQEKIDPRVLVENLRRTAQREEDEPEYSLFGAFDGLSDWESVEYYRHPANWSNRMILGDSLEVMASLAEREDLRGKVQMIYFDPPYGIKFGSNWQVSTQKRDVKDGKLEDASREVEQIKAFRDTWELGIHSYLAYLRDRLIVSRDLLTTSGSVFLQIGDENVHLVRSVLDEVFGSENFISQISYAKTASATSEFLPGTLDYILWYSRDKKLVKYKPIFTRREVAGAGGGKYTSVELDSGERVPVSRVPMGEGRAFRYDNITSQGAGRAKGEGAASWFPVTIDGKEFRPTMQSRWKTNQSGMDRLILAHRVAATGNTLSYVRYHDDFPAYRLTSNWADLGGVQSRSDPKVYVVQTSTTAVERCLLMTTDPGDLVLDPTCGSGTTSVVAEQHGRRWITTDTSRVSLALARQRVMGVQLPYYLLLDSPEGQRKEAALRGDGVTATSSTRKDVRRGFVYERVPHVTLKSIANNPDIVEGMSRDEINAAIARHAETELLYDRPYEDKKKVRVSGPFTVESLSPHRSVSYESELPASEVAGRSEDASSSYEKSILDNLRAAGVQNGRRQERLEFEELEPFPGKYLQAVGVRQGAGDGGSPQSVAVCLGPEYGTVSAQMVKEAAREALRGQGYDLLLVLGFAFDAMALETVDEFRPSATGDFAAVAAERTVGRLPVLLVRMNPDLAMGDELLKKTKAANLFTVFGEPDVAVERSEEGLVVEIRGLDVYDPTTGEVRSNEPDEIALWMIDTDYDGESFFVRHCYFSGGGVDPYARLKKALRADIDEAAWATLYGTRSRTFPAPTTGRIAVKAINHYGDEVLKIIDVGDR